MNWRSEKQQLVDLFDPSLEFIDLLEGYNNVYRVRQKKRDCVLKWGSSHVSPIDGGISYPPQVEAEAEFLNRFGGFVGIPKLYDVYQSEDKYFVALLKEFIPGVAWAELKHIPTQTLLSLKQDLETALAWLKNRGVAVEDGGLANAILTPDMHFRIIDFGCVSYAKDFYDTDFEEIYETGKWQFTRAIIEQLNKRGIKIK